MADVLMCRLRRNGHTDTQPAAACATIRSKFLKIGVQVRSRVPNAAFAM